MQFMIAALLAFLIAAPAWAANREARCIELEDDGDAGTVCLMSEPLNTNSYSYSGGSCSTGNETITFGDSTGAGSKPASDYGMITCNTQSAVATSTSDVDLPTGTSEIDYVLRQDPDSVSDMSDSKSVGSQKRLCARVYRKVSGPPETSTYRTAYECGADKQVEFWGSATYMQISGNPADDQTPSAYIMAGFPDSGQVTDFGSGDTMSSATCVDNWCRYEMCIYSSSGISGLDDIYMEGYITQVGVESPLSTTFGPTYVGDSSETYDHVWPTTGYRLDTGCSTSASETGYHYTTHAMVATWDTTSQGTFIGAASEVEGDGSPTWDITNTTSPSGTCTHNTNCDDVDVILTGSGTATGTNAATVDCNAIGGDDDEDATDSGDQDDFTFTDACDYNSLTVGNTYTITGRSTRESVEAEDTVTLTINGEAPTAVASVTAQAPGTDPATLDLDGDSSSCEGSCTWEWTYTSGSGCSITADDEQSTTATGCPAGTHEFQLEVTNETDSDADSDSAVVAAASATANTITGIAPGSTGWLIQ